MKHKETFFQGAFGGAPSHWVVQYYDSQEPGFPKAAYFNSFEEAEEFETSLDNMEPEEVKHE